MTAAHLVLADGTVFTGRGVGAPGVAVGEVVFNTSMTGYQEIISDPSYAGQIVTMTAPHIGNYGVNEADLQRTTPALAGLVMRAVSRTPSSWRSQGSLPSYLESCDIVAITEVDTRRLTRHIRSHGAMAAALGSDREVGELRLLAERHGSMSGRNLAETVSVAQPGMYPAEGATRAAVVALDLGMKRDILSQLQRRGIEVEVVPAATATADVLQRRPDGVFLSNGPGDPEPVTAAIATVEGLLDRVPVFGICLGHQILGLALGAATYKLPFGHHGGNHPVQRLADGSVSITAQNHGFAVDLWSLSPAEPTAATGELPGRDLLPEQVDTAFGPVVPTHQNLNDGTLEGLACTGIPAFSVQYHPEAAPGPNDATELFDQFAHMIGAGDATA